VKKVIRYIGDVHGKFRAYKRLIQDSPPSIQVGDMGVGFIRWPHGEPEQNPPFDAMVEADARFLRGNHDNFSVCRRHRQFIRDGLVENDTMFIGGAASIDREHRTEGYSWWPDEELGTQELNSLVDVYLGARPRIMVTHDCPEQIASIVCAIAHQKKISIPSRTRQALQSMWEMHKPEAWVFGHWHFSFDHEIEGTRFICLNELEHRDLAL
jgi:hypothetical protein